jgi:hypothetical protein
MKRLALLSAVAMMLASAVFAPVAMAQEVGEVDVQSVRLGPAGSVTVTGTIECLAGHHYFVDVSVIQRTSGNRLNNGVASADGECGETTGPIAFTATGFGRVGEVLTPFRRGPAAIQPQSGLCDPSFNCPQWHGELESVNIR